MDLVNRFKAWFLPTFIQRFHPTTTTTTTTTTTNTPAPVVPNDHNPQPPVLIADDRRNIIDWSMIMIGFCFPSAVEIALQSLQTKSELPPLFHLLCLAIIFSFTFLFLSKFMNSKFPVIARVLEGLGVLFAVTAIFVAITIPLPLSLKCVTWTLYAIFLIALIVCIYNQ
ncbi:putative GTPase IMAP family member 1 [Melia azedarach]|uniref:GTPase IMAP family member 1 n=1 Tax=Melia azedarach TaxID=155640 RepID=A0ACC1XP64_MELAZ|nr:putative GTPase IMAP family member 1 [Melia azedarach]